MRTSHWADNEIHQYEQADISIVTASPDDFVVPIVGSAESKSVGQISPEIRTLVARARAKYFEDERSAVGVPRALALAYLITGKCVASTALHASLSVDHCPVYRPLVAAKSVAKAFSPYE
jgi:hypothetical protein